MKELHPDIKAWLEHMRTPEIDYDDDMSWLNLSQCDLSAKMIRKYVSHEIKILDFSQCRGNPKLILKLMQPKHLWSFTMNHQNIIPEILKELSVCPKLYSLTLNSVGLHDHLLLLDKFTKLSHLQLWDNQINHLPFLSRKWKRLKNLHLDDNPLNLAHFSTELSSTKLESLSLDDTPTTDGFAEIINQQVTLKSLSILNTKLTAQFFTDLSRHCHLQTIVTSIKISEQFIKAIKKLKQLQTLVIIGRQRKLMLAELRAAVPKVFVEYHSAR